jgi:uncharacterized protein
MNRNFAEAQGKQRRLGEVRVAGDEGAMVIAGYAARYNVWSKDLGGFRERLSPGCFTRAVETQNVGEGVVCLYNHNRNAGVFGRTTAGTLTLSEDAKGLFYRCQLDKNQESHRSLWNSIKRGDVQSCSFGFYVATNGDTWEDGTDPETGARCVLRTIKAIDELLDVSPVALPAYPETNVEARNRGAAAKPDYAAQKLVEATRAMSTQYREYMRKLKQLRESPYPDPYNYRDIETHLACAHDMLETARGICDAVDDLVDDWPDDDSRAAKPSHRTFVDTHKLATSTLQQCSLHMANARLELSRCMKAGK